MSKIDKIFEFFQLVVFLAVGALCIGSYVIWYLHLQQRKAERKIWEIENCSWEAYSQTSPKKREWLDWKCRKVWR